MDHVLLYKGAFQIITSNAKKGIAEQLYQRITAFFERRNCEVECIETLEKETLEHLLRSNTKYVVAHSLGTSVFIGQFTEGMSESLQAIFLFDPSDQIRDKVNKLSISNEVFMSSFLGRPYATGFRRAHYFADDHYFSRSWQSIETLLQQTLDTTG